jgi:diguanylate cyclase
VNAADHGLIGPSGFQTAHEVIDLLAEAAIPPTPPNYELWLHYKLATNHDLRREIESMRSRGEPFTDMVCKDLYDRYFADPAIAAEMAETSERIAKELAALVATLSSAGDQTGSYGQALSRAQSTLEQNPDINTLKNVISDLTFATKQMADSNRILSSQLRDASSEMTQLRASLVKVRAEAMSDGLSGLGNRKMFDLTLRQRFSEAAADRTDLCLLLCDIDHFKKFNDTWGHPTGDQIIRFIASSMQKAALPDYLPARYGGEEFAMIMPRTGLAEARMVAESLRVAIESKKLFRRSTNEDLGRVTISVGIAKRTATDTPASLLERADAALYASKRGGRNRVTTDMEQLNRNVA